MKPASFHLSFRIKGGTFTSQDISTKLGLAPKIVRSALDRRIVLKADSSEAAGYWTHRFAFEQAITLGQGITSCIDILQIHKEILHKLSDSGSRLEFFIGIEINRSYGIELNWLILQRAAQLKIDLAFDLYDANRFQNEAATDEQSAF